MQGAGSSERLNDVMIPKSTISINISTETRDVCFEAHAEIYM
jgi:hypothetical protein